MVQFQPGRPAALEPAPIFVLLGPSDGAVKLFAKCSRPFADVGIDRGDVEIGSFGRVTL